MSSRAIRIVALCILAAMVQGCAGSNVPDPGPTANEVGLTNEPELIATPTASEEKPRFAGFLRRDRALPEPDPSRRISLFGFLAKPAADEGTTPATESTAAATAPASEPEVLPNVRADDEESEPIDTPLPLAGADPPRRGGLLGLFGGRNPRAPRDADALATPAVLPIGDLPFGTVVKACGVNRRAMGTEVARHSETGFRIFDTDASGTAPRTQYLVGFKDGCPRQFTASLALFGSPDVHEATRYNDSNSKPYSETDEAYETIKNRVCRVRRGEHCADNKIKQLNRQAAFVSVYQSFGVPGPWVEMFLNRGQLAAYQTNTP